MISVRTRKLGLGLLVAAALSFAGWYTYRHFYGISEYRYPADKQAVMKILQDNWYMMVSESSVDFSAEYEFTHKSASTEYPDGSLHIFVYRKHGKPVAFSTYYRSEPGLALIQFLGVDRDYRRHGYAQTLLEYVLEHALAHGFTKARLAVRENNVPASRLYSKLGFKEFLRDDGFIWLEKSLL